MKTILSLALVTALSTLGTMAFADELPVVNKSYSSVKVKTLNADQTLLNETCLQRNTVTVLQDLNPNENYTVVAELNSGFRCDESVTQTFQLDVRGFNHYSQIEVTENAMNMKY